MSAVSPSSGPFAAARCPPGRHAAALGIRYRPISDADMAFLKALYRSTREGEMAATPWSEAEKQAFIAIQFDAQHRHYQANYPDADWLVVLKGETLIGRLYLERWRHEHRIIDIALMPEARGGGLGTAILKDVMEEASAAGKAVGIHVEKTNPAMTLYLRLGFAVIEDKGVYDLLSWRAVE